MGYDNIDTIDDWESYESASSDNSKLRKNKLLQNLKNIESYEIPVDYHPTTEVNTFLPSNMIAENEDRRKKELEKEEYDADEWFNDLIEQNSAYVSISKSIKKNIFDDGEISYKKKKKKKNKKGEKNIVDYKKEFAPEMALYKNLLVAQNKFTDSLQKEYDHMKSLKSSSRGVSRQMSELVENITDARALSMQLVDKHVSVKKAAADLELKQKKELGAKIDSENASMADFGSSYIRKLLDNRNMFSEGDNMYTTVSEYSDDSDMISEISSMLENDPHSRSDESMKYLKYENSNIDINVVITNNDISDYEFIATDINGDIVDDYPLPDKTDISINRSTNVATDKYGVKYNIIWKNDKI